MHWAVLFIILRIVNKSVCLSKLFFLSEFFFFIILQLTVLTVYAFLYGKAYLVSWISLNFNGCSFFKLSVTWISSYFVWKVFLFCSKFPFSFAVVLLCQMFVVTPDLGLWLVLSGTGNWLSHFLLHNCWYVVVLPFCGIFLCFDHLIFIFFQVLTFLAIYVWLFLALHKGVVYNI